MAVYTIEKLLELGAIPVTASDSTGYIYEEDGFTTETLEHLNDVKVVKHGTLKDYKSKNGKCCTALHILIMPQDLYPAQPNLIFAFAHGSSQA